MVLSIMLCVTLALLVNSRLVSGYDDKLPVDQFPLSLSHTDFKPSNGPPLQQSGFTVGQNVVISSTVSGELGNSSEALYIVQAKDGDDIVQFINVSQVRFPGEHTILELNSTWVPEQSGVYAIEIFVWKSYTTTDVDQHAVITAVSPIMEKWRTSFVFVSPSKVQTSKEGAQGISLIFNKIGMREFYQDRKVFLPTDLRITKNGSADWQLLAWPSIGPNHVISRLEQGSNASATVFDYYATLGIDMSQIRYDEFIRSKDIDPLPAQGGRFFGFDWNQTSIDGTRAGPGRYQVYLTMPVLIGDSGTGDDKRFKVILRSESEYFTILEGPPNDLHHDLSLRIVNLTKTSLTTEELLSYALVLVNNGDHPEYLTVDSNSLNFMPAESTSGHASSNASSCTLSGTGGVMYASYFIHERLLMPGSRVILQNDTLVEPPRSPGIYSLSGPVILSIADEPM